MKRVSLAVAASAAISLVVLSNTTTTAQAGFMAGTIEGVLYSFVWGGRTAESQEAQCELTVNGEITELAVAAVVWKDGQLVHVECELPDGEGVVVLDHSGESGPACRVWLFATTTVINDLRGNLEGVDSVGCEVVAP